MAPRVVAPVDDHGDRFFWDAAREGKLLIQRCRSCGTLRHPPAPMCGRCGSLEWEGTESTGRGTVHSWIVSRHPSRPDDEPRVVVLVDLAEGTRLVSNLVDVDPAEVRNEMPVEVCFVAYNDGDVVLPQFRPATSTRGEGD